VGAVFVGHNLTPERSWDMRCKVFVADRRREFAFATTGRRAVTAQTRTA
jgi:hypothetical protein